MKRYHVKVTFSVEALGPDEAQGAVAATAKYAAAGVPTMEALAITSAKEVPEPEVWNRYSVPAAIYITARSEAEAGQLLIAMTKERDNIPLPDHEYGACAYLGVDGGDPFLDKTPPELQSTDAIPPGGYS